MLDPRPQHLTRLGDLPAVGQCLARDEECRNVRCLLIHKLLQTVQALQRGGIDTVLGPLPPPDTPA